MMGELVLNEVEGKKFFYNLNRLFPLLVPIFQHSSIPVFHSDAINRLTL